MLNFVDEARGWPGEFDILFILHVSRLRTRVLEVVRRNNAWIGGRVDGWIGGWMDDVFVHSEATLRDEKETKQGVGSSTMWMKHVIDDTLLRMPGGFDILFILRSSRLRTQTLELVQRSNA